MSYALKHKMEKELGEIIKEGCHMMKTKEHIAVFFFCDNEKLNKHKTAIDRALKDVRKRYSVYVMTENEYNSSR